MSFLILLVMRTTDFGRYISGYLGKYLPAVKGMSTNSIKAYRDTFTLLLRYCGEVRKMDRTKIDMAVFTRKMVEDFLDWLENARNVSARTRNARLAALKSFFSYVVDKDPSLMMMSQNIMSIPQKKVHRKSIAYLSSEAMKLLLEQPDQNTRAGRRDMSLLALMYDTGARVQEIADLRVCDIRKTKPYTVTITGKGSKTRIVPMSDCQMSHLFRYMKEFNMNGNDKADWQLFCNRQGGKLTRAGISFILKKYVEKARQKNPAVMPDGISCHSLRHSKAMHLLQADVPLIYIRDLLGHESVTTTEIYARIDSKKKRDVLEKAYKPIIPKQAEPSWLDDGDLLCWLKSL